MSPGMSVVPGSVTRVVPSGTRSESTRPTATMRSPSTSTANPVRGAPATPSHTASGTSSVVDAARPSTGESTSIRSEARTSDMRRMTSPFTG